LVESKNNGLAYPPEMNVGILQLRYLKVFTLAEGMLDMQVRFVRVKRVISCWTLQYVDFACSVNSPFLNAYISQVNRRSLSEICKRSVKVLEKVVSFDKYPLPVKLHSERHRAALSQW